MRLKYFYLGLLSVLASTQIEGAMKQTYRAPQIEKELEKAKDVEAKIAPNLNVAAHGNKIENAAQDVHDKLGAANAPSGGTTNHRIADLHTTLGHAPGGAAGDPANKRAEDVATRLGTKAAHPTGPSVHDKLTDLMAIQGDITNSANDGGVNSGHGGPNPEDLAETAINREEKILARLKAGIAALSHDAGSNEYRLRTIATTKGAGTGRNLAPTAPDKNAAEVARNIEDLLAYLGW